jgi:hypothetical protein
MVVDNLGKSYKHLDKPVSGTKESEGSFSFPSTTIWALDIKRVSLNLGMFRNRNTASTPFGHRKGFKH